MSFSSLVKQEIMNRRLERPCCNRAQCFGAACFSYAFSANELEIHTESNEVAEYLAAAFGQQQLPLRQGSWWSHGRELVCLVPTVQQNALAEFYREATETQRPTGKVRKVCEGCVGAWLAGAFLAGGTVSDPEKEYHLEFILPHAELSGLLCEKLAFLGIEGRSSKKNGSGIVYLSASEQIEDLLTAMGAAHCAMDIMNEKIYKDYRNQANRITNCETANIDKIVAANGKVLTAIDQLRRTGVLNTLPEVLQQAAAARLAEPDVSLAELAASMQPPVSKSGLSHRFSKLVELAGEQKDKEREGRKDG